MDDQVDDGQPARNWSVEQKLPPGIIDGKWHHLVWNYRGEELRAVYVDGELKWSAD